MYYNNTKTKRQIDYEITTPTVELRGRAFNLKPSDKNFRFPKPHTSKKVHSTPGPTPAMG